MHALSQLKIGDKLNIERFQTNISLEKQDVLKSQLIDLNKDHIYISAPTYKGKKFSLYKGQKISILFYRDGGAYQFYAKVIKQTKTNITAFIVKPTSDLIKIQRRDHYRLSIAINITIERINKQNGKLQELQCITNDLSGGGAKITCSEQLEEGENIKVSFCLDEEGDVTANGVVVRVIEEQATKSYELGIRFNKISQVNEDKIYAFIFRKQRSLRKKGLI